uniref:Uncharacterized protein n=1 Tax=Monopterus albus TaxID=43700 RepID=A0A3Q3RB38_MONAL
MHPNFLLMGTFLLLKLLVNHIYCRSAPLTCKDLLRPLDQVDLHHLEGRWALVAGSLSDPTLIERFGRRDSASSSFFNNTSESSILFKRILNMDNKCHSSSYNISLEGSSFTIRDGNVTTTFTHTTCHDCILLSFDVESGKRQHFYLFSRRRQLEQREMEEFRAQVACLNMPPPVVMDPTKELSSKDSDATAQPEIKTVEQKN